MILADTSAWVEYLRMTGSSAHRAMKELWPNLCATPPVAMEVLAGARNEREAMRLRTVLLGTAVLDVSGPLDFDAAAAIYRACRRAGRMFRGQLDCLIAAVAIRHGVPLLHSDADFDFIAEHTGLEIYEPA